MDNKDLMVRKSNALTRAPWRGLSSLWGPRIIAAITALVHDEDEDFREYEIDLFGFVRSTLPSVRVPRNLSGEVIRQIDVAIKELMNTLITFEDKDGQGERYKAYFNIFYFCAYFPRLGKIKASFAPQMKPFFLDLKSHFTLYPLTEFLGLGSMYSQKLYEFLSSWKSAPSVKVPLEQLYDVLDVAESYRRFYGKFRQDVLDPAEREINGKTSLRYTWEPVKTGRKVTSVIFRFGACRTGDDDTELSQRLTAKAADEDYAKWQRLSNACFARHFERGEVCKPGKGKKCTFCRTRGRLMGRTAEEAYEAVRRTGARIHLPLPPNGD